MFISHSMSAFAIVPLFVSIIFLIVFGIIISRLVNYGAQKSKPKESLGARVIGKREHVWGDRSRTSYYATFELESGERLELNIPSHKIGYLVEGDIGVLTKQGTLFVEFNRQDSYDESYY